MSGGLSPQHLGQGRLEQLAARVRVRARVDEEGQPWRDDAERVHVVYAGHARGYSHQPLEGESVGRSVGG